MRQLAIVNIKAEIEIVAKSLLNRFYRKTDIVQKNKNQILEGNFFFRIQKLISI